MTSVRTFAFLLTVLLLACGGPPPPKEPIDRLYHSLAEKGVPLDRAGLAGRRILIDPGHGGRFTGTTGRGGLQEKDVNLGVALYLWGLLRDAGADAHLTRTSDRDFVGGDSSATVAQDLAARIAIADSIRPHFLLSIHHNAAADTNRSRNQIETYYPAGEEGPSLDAARAIHEHLARNLGIDDGRVVPGNFYLLRESRYPAVLGEPSYLSHPPVEEKLVLGEKQKLEAEAYFLGIVEYFSRGTPTARCDLPEETVGAREGLRFEGLVADEEGFPGIDPSTIRLALDGKELPHLFDPATGRVTAGLPEDLSPGEHRTALRARNLEGNACRETVTPFRVQFPPVRAEVEGFRMPPEGGTVLTITLRDERGLPVADGTIMMSPPEVGAVKGKGEFHVTEKGAFLKSLPPGPLPEGIPLWNPESSLIASVDASRIKEPPALLLLLDDQGEPVEGAQVWVGQEPAGLSRRGGWVLLSSPPEPGAPIRVEASGCGSTLARREESGTVVDTLLLPRKEALPLAGKRILIDPAGDPGGGIFPPSSQSLTAALYLEEMFRWAGARPALTRRGEIVPPEGERIPLAGQLGAAYWITVAAGESTSVRHFPGSEEGAPLARRVAEEIAEERGSDVPVRTGTEPVLRLTPCPAIVVTIPPLEGDGRRIRAGMRALAQAVGEGLRRHIDGDGAPRGTVVVDSLLPGALVRVDDEVTFQMPLAGALRIDLPRAGSHRFWMEGEKGWVERWVDVAPGETIHIP